MTNIVLLLLHTHVGIVTYWYFYIHTKTIHICNSPHGVVFSFLSNFCVIIFLRSIQSFQLKFGISYYTLTVTKFKRTMRFGIYVFFVTILAGHLSYFSWENVFWIYTIFYRDSHLTIKKIAVCPPPLGAISGYFGGIWGFVPIFRGYFSMAWATQHFIMIFSTKLPGINLYFLNISISVDIYLSKSTYLGSAHT